MATNSDLVSIIKTLVNLQDTKKDSTETNEHQDAIESSSAENKSLEQGEQLSLSTLVMAFLGLSSTLKENMKEMKDLISNKFSRLEERVYTLEDVVERRLTAIESECCSSLEVVSDRLCSLEENMSMKTKAIVDRLSSLEEKECTSEETKAIADRLSSLEENMSTSSETKATADGLSSLENSMVTLEEVKSIGEKLEEKLTLLAEMKHSTVKEEGFISKELTVPQCFDSAYKGKNIVLSNDSQTAERIGRPRYFETQRTKNDSRFYGGVISKFPLKSEEVFQIVIEESIDKYMIFGIAFGVIDKKAKVEEKCGILFEIKGTWGIEGCGCQYGMSHIYKDNYIINRHAYPLDLRGLTAGTVLGVKLKSNGDLHFYKNGEDKGVAFKLIPKNVYAFVDVMNSVTKISILK